MNETYTEEMTAEREAALAEYYAMIEEEIQLEIEAELEDERLDAEMRSADIYAYNGVSRSDF